MQISPEDLARLLSDAGHDSVAREVSQGPEVELSKMDRETLVAIYRVRCKIQTEAGRYELANRIGEFLDVISAQKDPTIYGCIVADADRYYLVFLDSRADGILAVLVPPRGPDGVIDRWRIEPY